MFRVFVLILLSLLVSTATAGGNGIKQADELLELVDAPPGGDFSLTSPGREFSLSQLRGKVVLLYFGYTRCPDICPTSLLYLSQALNELNEDELEGVRALFVSVDPERDTPEVLDEYSQYFHPNMMGVTGGEQEIAKAARLYGAQYYQVELKGSPFGYSVNHSAATYLVTPEGELRFIFPYATPSSVILEAIRYVIGGN